MTSAMKEVKSLGYAHTVYKQRSYLANIDLDVVSGAGWIFTIIHVILSCAYIFFFQLRVLYPKVSLAHTKIGLGLAGKTNKQKECEELQKAEGGTVGRNG
jgi:hypothetical protein